MGEKWTLQKIQWEKNRLFTKYIVQKMYFSQNSMSEKQTFHKFHYRGMKRFLHKYVEKL